MDLSAIWWLKKHFCFPYLFVLSLELPGITPPPTPDVVISELEPVKVVPVLLAFPEFPRSCKIKEKHILKYMLHIYIPNIAWNQFGDEGYLFFFFEQNNKFS